MGHHRVPGDHHLKDLLAVDPRGVGSGRQGLVDALRRKLLQPDKAASAGEVHPREDILAAGDLAVVVRCRGEDPAVDETPEVGHDRGRPEIHRRPVEPLRGVALVDAAQAVAAGDQGDRGGHVPPAPAKHLREIAEDAERRVDPVRGRPALPFDPFEQAGEVGGRVLKGRRVEADLVLPDGGVERDLLHARDLDEDLLLLDERPGRDLDLDVAGDGRLAGKACPTGDLLVREEPAVLLAVERYRAVFYVDLALPALTLSAADHVHGEAGSAGRVEEGRTPRHGHLPVAGEERHGRHQAFHSFSRYPGRSAASRGPTSTFQPVASSIFPERGAA
ncbi:hypothetical protein DSECCO2_531230 [anaerobic digester metagenome]